MATPIRIINKLYLSLTILVLTLVSCQRNHHLPQINIENIYNSLHVDKDILLLYFFLPDCVISEAKHHKMDSLYRFCSINNIQFIGILPLADNGEHYLTDIKERYQITFPVVIDSLFTISNDLGASIAPSCYLFKDKSLIYSGAIDDEYFDLSRKKKNPDLNCFICTSIISAISEDLPKQVSTQPIGCIFR
jgi:hypothetical protein